MMKYVSGFVSSKHHETPTTHCFAHLLKLPVSLRHMCNKWWSRTSPKSCSPWVRKRLGGFTGLRDGSLTLPETNSEEIHLLGSHLKKKGESLPSIHFYVLCEFSEGNPQRNRRWSKSAMIQCSHSKLTLEFLGNLGLYTFNQICQDLFK